MRASNLFSSRRHGRIRSKLTYANVTATMALVFAMAGGATATGERVAEIAGVKKNSVGGPQIKRNAITSKHIRNRSLTASDFRLGQLPSGPPGTAKAWGRVSSSGVVAVGQNLIASKVEGQPGRYCIGVAPGLQMTIPILANEYLSTPDWGDIQSNNEWEAGIPVNPQCPQGMFRVVRQNGDGGFHVIIP